MRAIPAALVESSKVEELRQVGIGDLTRDVTRPVLSLSIDRPAVVTALAMARITAAAWARGPLSTSRHRVSEEIPA